jgi:hypothetical protein
MHSWHYFPKVYVSLGQEEGFEEKRRLVDHSLTADSFLDDKPVLDELDLYSCLFFVWFCLARRFGAWLAG